MKHKRLYKIASVPAALVLLGMLWIAQASSTSVSEADRYPVFLPIVNRPLCDFPKIEPGYVFEHEPNDIFAKAIGPIRPYEIVWGCFSGPNDVDDVYYFDLTVPSSIEVRLTNIPAGHNYDLVLYDKDEDRITYSKKSGNEDEIIRSEKELPGGRYYVQVYNAGKKASGQTYKLEIEYDLSYACDHPAIIFEMFPQLREVHNVFAFYSKAANFECKLVTDIVHSGYLAMRLDYEAGNDDGYWGIATTEGFDASKFGDVCIWAYAEERLQTFTINLKDMAGTEKPSTPQTIVETNKWKQFCVPLTQYSARGVQLDQLENVNIHFNKALGDAVIWVDDIKFSLPCDHPVVTAEVFPQLKDELDQFPFYAVNEAFQCQVVEDIVASEPIGLRLKYAAGDVVGYWGVATQNGYNASGFERICYSAFAEEPHQTFAIHLKDKAGTEKASIPQIIDKADAWKRFCVPLAQFETQGVQLDKIENVNVHFSKELRDAAVWIDDLAYERD